MDRCKPLRELTLTEKTVNRALSTAKASVERGVARLKSWRIFRRSRCSPNPMTSKGSGPGGWMLPGPDWYCLLLTGYCTSTKSPAAATAGVPALPAKEKR